MTLASQTWVYFLGAFLLGSFPTAYLWGRYAAGSDIRSQGSGNVGATNAFRVYGKKAGILVFAVDFLKGLLPVLVCRFAAGATETSLLFVAFGAIMGHVFTPFLGFKGGKGIATGAGGLTGSIPLVFACALPVWIAAFLIWRTVSVSSLLAVISTVVFAWFFRFPPSALALLAVLSAFLVWTHRSNLARLARGDEKKIR